MFHLIHLKKIKFTSNPPLDPVLSIALDVNENGDPINKVVFAERQHPLKGLHYDPATMSLRSMIKYGFQLHPVSLGQTENDPNRLTASARRLSSALSERVSSRQSVPVSSETSETKSE